jgi:hypothetical protein
MSSSNPPTKIQGVYMSERTVGLPVVGSKVVSFRLTETYEGGFFPGYRNPRIKQTSRYMFLTEQGQVRSQGALFSGPNEAPLSFSSQAET